MRKLYAYWRSSASYRVRIALNLKQLDYDIETVNLIADGGEQHNPEYRRLNAQRLLPTLIPGEGMPPLTQSLAIVEYLEQTHPEPPLLPTGPVERARVRALALAIGCEIQPLQNLRVGAFLKGQHGFDDDAVAAWNTHWITRGLDAFEGLLQHAQTGTFCHGDSPTFADIFLVPQVYNARRFEIDLSAYPQISRIEASCQKLSAFREAAPENQPDAQG